jgi:hypothetical protein
MHNNAGSGAWNTAVPAWRTRTGSGYLELVLIRNSPD